MYVFFGLLDINSPKSPGNRGLAQSISGSTVQGQAGEAPPSENTYDRTSEMPLSNPSVALKDALRFLEQDDWCVLSLISYTKILKFVN